MAVQQRVVAHALFDYIDPEGVRRVALRGETVEVDGEALARGEEYDAFYADGEEPAAAPADVLEAEIGEILPEDLAAAVVDLDDDQRAALRAALDAADVGAASSPPGAQAPVVPPADDEGDDDEVDEVERPPLTANKGIWLAFRGLDDLSEEQANAVTVKQLQDDAFMVSYQRPTA